jgi:uncharacterized membrane protein (DUF373 family)
MLNKVDSAAYQSIVGVERIIVRALIGMMLLAILIGTVQLAGLLIRDILRPPVGLFTLDEMFELFGQFMLVLIGIELMDTVKSYIAEHHVRVESVIMVALIAISRKVIVMEQKDFPPTVLLGIAALILALGVAHYLLRHRAADPVPPPPP